jgi:release factor glutamine methyltransferase
LPEPAAAVQPAIRDALARGAGELAAAGCETPRLDAELLLAEALDVDRSRRIGRAELVIRARDALPAGAAERYAALIARRRRREPVAYILGRREFRRLTLDVDRRVLIPRPETELLMEVGLRLPAGARVADVGTGSGAVALALKDERPDLDVTGIELGDEALAVARANARRLGLDVRWVLADLLDDGRYDAVLANLPYVQDGFALPPDVALHEPATALFAGPDGLDQIRRLITAATARPELTTLALEIGFDQADTVAALLDAAGLRSVVRMRDLAGHERVVVGQR